jgi:hypothetical protein
MLGEMLGEEIGQMTGMRVLATEGLPKIEVSYQASGTIYGVHTTDAGTYISTARPNGTMFGEGQGVVMGENGERAMYRGQGRGHFTGRGTAVSWRGVVFYEVAPGSDAMMPLNDIASVFEFEVDEMGKVELRFWEWK